MEKQKKILYSFKLYIISKILIFVIVIAYLLFFNSIKSYHVAIKRNYITGKVELDTIPGYKLNSPFVQVVRIDTRPMRLCIPSGSRNINCRLVQFDINGWKDFLKAEGVRYYWLDNRISFNFGHKEEYRGMKDVMLGYTFDNTNRSFIKNISKIE